MPYEYRYPRPALTVDCAVFAPAGRGLDVLLVERDEPPFEGCWATPGGFVEIDEPVGAAAARELREETGLEEVELEEFGTFTAPGRDPRGRIVTLAHWGLVDRESVDAEAASDARSCGWHPVDELPDTAFDHRELVETGLRALRNRARTGAVGRQLVEEPFEFGSLVELYEGLLGGPVDTAALREALVDRAGVLQPLDDRPSRKGEKLYEFDAATFDRLRRTPRPLWELCQ